MFEGKIVRVFIGALSGLSRRSVRNDIKENISNA